MVMEAASTIVALGETRSVMEPNSEKGVRLPSESGGDGVVAKQDEKNSKFTSTNPVGGRGYGIAYLAMSWRCTTVWMARPALLVDDFRPATTRTPVAGWPECW